MFCHKREFRMKIMGLLLTLILSMVASSAIASKCERAKPTTHPEFCSSFREVTRCHCMESLPKNLCSSMSMDTLYNLMVARFGTMEKACNQQKDTSPQDCMDNWNCYRNGGSNSQGGACSGTGKKCS